MNVMLVAAVEDEALREPVHRDVRVRQGPSGQGRAVEVEDERRGRLARVDPDDLPRLQVE